MCLLVRLLQSLDRDVRIDLRGGQACVTQQLLDRPEVCTALEQVSSSAVPQTVRPYVWGVWHMLQHLMNSRTNLRTTSRSITGW